MGGRGGRNGRTLTNTGCLMGPQVVTALIWEGGAGVKTMHCVQGCMKGITHTEHL